MLILIWLEPQGRPLVYREEVSAAVVGSDPVNSLRPTSGSISKTHLAYLLTDSLLPILRRISTVRSHPSLVLRRDQMLRAPYKSLVCS